MNPFTALTARHDGGPPMQFARTLRTLALFETAKGLLVLVAGFGLFSLGPQEIQHFAERLVRHSHLNPAARYPHIFLEIAQSATSVRLLLIAAGALAYTAVRLVEAYGLWYGRRWAEWFAALSGAIYVPFEIVEIRRHVSWFSIAALTVNVAIVVFMLFCVSRQAPTAPHLRR